MSRQWSRDPIDPRRAGTRNATAAGLNRMGSILDPMQRSSPAPRPSPEFSRSDPADGLRLLVTIPALNEESTVGDVIRAIPREIAGVGSIDILVVDDGSEDATGDVARAAGARVVRKPAPSGVGAAFHTALRDAQ